jgi:hypothetical protein
MIDIHQQIACMKRELGFRIRVYPGLIQRGKMNKAKADYEIQCIKTIMATLEGLAQAGKQPNPGCAWPFPGTSARDEPNKELEADLFGDPPQEGPKP